MKQQALVVLFVLSLLHCLSCGLEEEKSCAASQKNSSCSAKSENRYVLDEELEVAREKNAARIEAWWSKVLNGQR